MRQRKNWRHLRFNVSLAKKPPNQAYHRTRRWGWFYSSAVASQVSPLRAGNLVGRCAFLFRFCSAFIAIHWRTTLGYGPIASFCVASMDRQRMHRKREQKAQLMAWTVLIFMILPHNLLAFVSWPISQNHATNYWTINTTLTVQLISSVKMWI